MSSNRWSSSSDDSGWHPAPSKFSQAPIATPEEIQIVLLGAPGTGKTRLQSRYTLRQFVDIDSHGMGGHKHLRLPDGTDVHLIIHELRTGRGSGARHSSSQEDRTQEDCQRKRLLEQSDAVMLLFNPWSKASYEWINGKVVQDILYTGRKKQLTSDIVRLLDGLAAAMPKRSTSTRSAMTFNSLMKKLPRRPDDVTSDDEVSLFSNEDEEKGGEDRIDYRGELKRISIVVEGSALKKAEFMIHEKDLPSPPPQSPTPSPLAVVSPRRSRLLPTISEVDESSKRRQQQRVAVMMDKRHLPIMKHDSIISLQSDSSASSTYSETATTAIGTTHESSLLDNTHPVYRENSLPDAVLDESTGQLSLQRSSTRTPTEECEVPVLVVATMTDRLKDTGGTLERHVTPNQGQRLARKFGPNCAYIETSAKTNANVDEAYGIIVDQVMAKRAAARRDELARARIEAAIAAVQAESRPATRMVGQRASRSCVPQWPWLDDLLARVPSWETVSEQVSRVFMTTGGGSGNGGEQSGDESAAVAEDVWGEEVVKNPPKSQQQGESKHDSKRRSKVVSGMSDTKRQSEQMSKRVRSGMGNRTMSHNPARDMSADTELEEMVDQGTRAVILPEKMKRQSQGWVVLPNEADPCFNPFEKDEFKRPMNMVTVTTLDPPKIPLEDKQSHRGADLLETLKHTSSFKGIRAAGTILEGGLDLTRKGSVNLRRAVSKKGRKADLAADLAADSNNMAITIPRRKSKGSRLPNPPPKEMQKRHNSAYISHVSTIREQAPSIPPLAFDAIIIDDKRASVSVLVRHADQERNEDTIEQFLTQDATRDSMVMMLSPTTATRTLSAFVKEINSARASGNTESVIPERKRQQQHRRASAGLPEVAPLPGVEVESEIEKRVKRVTMPALPTTEAPTGGGDDDDDGQDEFRTVMAPGMAGVPPLLEDTSLGVVFEEPLVSAAAVEQPSLDAVVESTTPAPDSSSAEKALPTTPPMPPPALKTGPLPPRKNSPSPPPPSSPPVAASGDNKLPTPAVPPIPETLPAVPAAARLASSKKIDTLSSSPIITTTEVHGGDSSEDEKRQKQQQHHQQQQRAKGPRTPTTPGGRTRSRVRDSKVLAMVKPTRPARPDSRPLSAWI